MNSTSTAGERERLRSRSTGDAFRTETLQRATVHLPAVRGTRTPVRDTLDHLQARGLLDTYELTDGPRDRPQTVVVRDYELSPFDGRLPMLPISAEAVRRAAGRPPVVTGATRVDDGWAVTLRDATRGSAASTAVRLDG